MSVKFEPKRLQQARSLRRMALADVGEKVDISRQALSQFERGDRTPSPETLEKIANALSFPIEFFWKSIGEIEGRSRSMITTGRFGALGIRFWTSSVQPLPWIFRHL